MTSQEKLIQEEIQNNIVRIAVENFTMPSTTQQTDSGVKLTGFAIPFNTESRNGFLYLKESLLEAAPSMVGRPLLWNHDVDKVIGHVEAFFEEQNGLGYRADIDPAEEYAVRKLKRGDVSNVSIRAQFNPEKSYVDEQSGAFHAHVTEFHELSVVTIPGFADTTAKMVESWNLSKTSTGDTMTEQEKKDVSVEETEERPAEAPAEQPAEAEEAPEEESTEEPSAEESLQALAQRVKSLEEQFAAMSNTATEEAPKEEPEEKAEEEPAEDLEEQLREAKTSVENHTPKPELTIEDFKSEFASLVFG